MDSAGEHCTKVNASPLSSSGDAFAARQLWCYKAPQQLPREACSWANSSCSLAGWAVIAQYSVGNIQDRQLAWSSQVNLPAAQQYSPATCTVVLPKLH